MDVAGNGTARGPGRVRAVGRATVGVATLGLAEKRRLDKEIAANVDVDDAMPVDGLHH